MKTWLAILGASAIMLVAVFVPHFNGWKPPQTITIATGQDVAMGASEPRSPLWPKVRAEHLAKNPECAACGYKGPANQCHHISPFHLGGVNDRGETLELDPTNLITLCGPGHRNHHLDIGHGGTYTCRNPNVREDAERFRKMRESKLCD